MTAPAAVDPDTAIDDPNQQEYTGGMIALIPQDPYPHALAVPGGLPPEQLHLTLAYLGDDVTDWDPELRAAVLRVVRQLVGTEPLDGDEPVPAAAPWAAGPLTLTVFAHAHFNPAGDEPCMVYQFQGGEDLNAVEALAGEVRSMVRNEIGEVNFPEQHARFEAHVTAGYGLAPDALTYVGPVVFDRIRIALAGDYIDVPLGTGGTVTAAAPTAPPTPAPSATAGAPVSIVKDTGDEIHVHWDALAVEGLDTGDGRYLTPGGGSHRALPLPLLSLPYKSHGGEQAPAAEVFGRLTGLELLPGPTVISKHTGEPFPEGTNVWSADAVINGRHPHAQLVRDGNLRGGSIDIGELDAELIDEEDAVMSDNPKRRAIMHTYQIAGATMVPVPAFADAYCDLVGQPDAPAALAASAMTAGVLTDPQPMVRARELGDYPDTPEPTTDGTGKDLEAMTAAAVAVRRPPLALFTNPNLDGETPITIKPVDIDGTTYHEVFGHIAVWSRPHIGYGGQRIYARPSRSDYAFFNTGAVRCLDEQGVERIAAVGHLTMDAPHADLALSALAATRHYDHTGFAWADVAAGDDKYGVWVHGICKPNITDDQISFAYAHPPSGDWRPIDGGLELVAALCVNTPGIPVSRARVASGQVLALVAAGALPPARPVPAPVNGDYAEFADMVAERIMARQARVAELTRQRDAVLAQLEVDDAATVGVLLDLIPDDDTTMATIGFDKLVAKLMAEGKSEESAKRIAASIGRKKYGAKGMVAKAKAAMNASVDDQEDDPGDDGRPAGGGRDELRELGLTDEQIDAFNLDNFDVSRMPPQLQKSYIAGKAAAKIGWGSDGDFDRCVAEARHHGIPARMRKGMCATLHKKATGKVPGKH